MDHVPPEQQHDADVGGIGRGALNGRAILVTLALLAAAGFAALGIWQVERRAWKLDLIARVDARIHAAPTGFPWGGGDPRGLEYRRVRLAGRYDHRGETRTQALTRLGAGFWVLTPLRTREGVVLVNRGFVPDARAVDRPAGPVSVTGLVRLSEPGGGFLRSNDPAAGRWYSRDVAAIAAARGLGPTPPLFVDAEAAPGAHGYPVAGLTVVRFRNTHLVYALTWFALAAMALAAAWLVLRRDPR